MTKKAESPKLARPVHTQPAGLAHTVDEALEAFAEIIARNRVLEDLGRGHRDADTTAKLELADAIETALGIDTTALYLRSAARIQELYQQFQADVDTVR